MRQPHTPASAEKTDARLACFMLQLGSLLLLWREAGLPPIDQAIKWPPRWKTAIETATKKFLLRISCGQLLLYIIQKFRKRQNAMGSGHVAPCAGRCAGSRQPGYARGSFFVRA
jgi:hypothetical protein